MISLAHAAILPSEALIRTRRDVYRFAATPRELPNEMLDNPLIRHALQVAMLARQPLRQADVLQAEAVETHTATVVCGSHTVKVVTATDADDCLSDVLAALATGPDRTSFLTAEDPAFAETLETLAAGAALAASVSPQLVEDVIPHVNLVAVLRPVEGNLAVHSASPRGFPGLILLGNPRTPIEVAEMLLHEGAHARYYDMIIVHDLLPPDADEFERFSPSWRLPGTLWPLEQVLAALHAYAVLAEFAVAAGVVDSKRKVGPSSLLKDAEARMQEIGIWVLDRLDRLGADAPGFVCGLLDREPPAPPTAPRGIPTLPSKVSVPLGLDFGFGDDPETVVVGRTDRPGSLYLLHRESGGVLQELNNDPSVSLAIDRFADRHCLPPQEARERVSWILAELAGQDLIAVRESSDAGARPATRGSTSRG